MNELISNIYVDDLPSREGLPSSPSPSEIGHVRSAPRNLMKKEIIWILVLDVANIKHTKLKSNYIKHKTDKAEECKSRLVHKQHNMFHCVWRSAYFGTYCGLVPLMKLAQPCLIEILPELALSNSDLR